MKNGVLKFLTESVPLGRSWGPKPSSKGISTPISTILSLDFDET